jgi:hypothetical protein
MEHNTGIVSLFCGTVTISADKFDIDSVAAITATKLVMAFTVTHNQGNWELKVEMMNNTIVIEDNR